jgi:hypothetical protein
LSPISFDKDLQVTSEEVFNSGIFIVIGREALSFTLPGINDLLKLVPEPATTGDTITFLMSSNETSTTIIPGEGGNIIGPTIVNAGQTRVLYIQFIINEGRSEYFIY